MKGFGGRRRSPGARRVKTAKPVVARRSRDAALGRETRGLLGPSKRRAGPAVPTVPAFPSFRNRGASKPGVRRFGRLVTPARAAGLLGMLAAGFLLTFVTGPSAFALVRTDVPALQWTDDGAVRAALAIPPGENVFRLETAPLEAALEALPAVAAADVRVALPDAALVVTVQERGAILAWDAGDRRFLVDREGVLFATLSREARLPAGVGIVEDRRTTSAEALAVGGHLDPVDLDVATRLGSLTPADAGSDASRLRVRITDPDGFVVFVEGGWAAIFGFYSPATRATSMIPGQVRLLRSLLAGREDTIARVILASDTDGTYVPKPTPKPTKR